MVAGAQLEVASGLLFDNGADLGVLTGVGCDVAKDRQLIDVGIIFRIEPFNLWMESGVGNIADSGVPKASPFSPTP